MSFRLWLDNKTMGRLLHGASSPPSVPPPSLSLAEATRLRDNSNHDDDITDGNNVDNKTKEKS